MIQLTHEFVDRCPVENGFRLRGLEMTRIEVFVDAAFAFALTLLVISFDAMPQNWAEVVLALKSIPAFSVAVIQLIWLWYEHSKWSRRYGLDDAMTVSLSGLLLITVLVYIYPMRMMASGMFTWFTDGYLPPSFDLAGWDQLEGMFVLLGVCFAALCSVFTWMNLYAARCSEKLLLSEAEIHLTMTSAWTWAGSGVIGLLSAAAAVLFQPPWVSFAGFVYALLGVWIPIFTRVRHKALPQ